ncbi:MAG: M2 family metallopeptidase [Gaiellaceae bacterium]
MDDASRLADAVEERLRPLDRERAVAWWDLNVQVSEENGHRRVATDIAYSQVLADAGLFASVGRVRAASGSALWRRRLDVLHDLMLPYQISPSLQERIVELEAEVEARFTRHRAVVRGSEVDDNEIKRILRRSDDPAERREAWEASKTVGAAVADDVRELARLRNEAARSVGHRDWYALSLATDELDERRLAETLAAADRVTVEPFAHWKAELDERLASRFGCSVGELRPWHYADPFFQEAPSEGGVDLDPLFDGGDAIALARRTFEAVGFDAASILERSDLYPRAGKCQHAFCVDIDREGDVRILANVVPTHSWAETMLHELGHGVYDLGLGEDLPWGLRTTHLVTTEATAILFGGLAWQREWLEHALELEPSEARALEDSLRAARVAELLVFTRWVLVMNGLERALYADPDSDLDGLWWELVHRHQLVTPPGGPRSGDWAAKIHVATAPVYYHTYLYGSIVALQIRDALRREVGGLVARPEAGALLRERLFAPGQSVRWDELVERVSGAPLSVAALEREVAAA